MEYRVQDLCDRFPEMIIAASNPQQAFSRIDSVESFGATSLIFISDKKHLPLLDASSPSVIVTSSALATNLAEAGKCVVTVKNVRLAQALIRQQLDDYNAADPEWEPIHPSSVIHPSASLHESVRVGPNTVIGADVTIGANTQVRANCVIEHGVSIGQDCVINNLVNIGYASSIGNRVILRTGVVIGGEGFGLAQDKEDSRYHRVPHTGVVEIGDDVQIGANSNVDRGTYGKTQILRGVKIDALCHVAHNVVIGEDSLLIAQCGIAGSSKIGKRVILSGHTGILDHKTITDDVVLLHRCGVTEDITSKGKWAGTPAKPFRDYVRDLNPGKKIEQLEKKIEKLSSEE
jgi:UDP-3-O-[3-hydroxymyristoyl] glucosamine N-acyltransferase